MGRIRKKLFLALKVTESMQDLHTTSSSHKRKRVSDIEDSGIAEEEPQVAMSQLKSLIRRGAETLTRPEIDVAEMTSWDLATILEKCKDKPADPQVKDESGTPADSLAPAAAEPNEDSSEDAWLAKMERVECAVFDGIKYARQREAEEAAPVEIRREDRRVGKNTTVMIGGFAVDKKTINNAKWEAVATFAGKDPRLAEPKREKAKPIEHQDHCQVCMDGGEVELCARCPRVYHVSCLPKGFPRALSGLNCPQHQCAECGHNTADAGGLMYRCRWCEKGHCEDCLDWNKARLVGETLPEFEVLGFENKKNAWFVECHACVAELETNPPWKEMIVKMKADAEEQYEVWSNPPVVMEAKIVEIVPEVPAPVPLDVKKATPKSKTAKEKTPKTTELGKKEPKHSKLNFTAPPQARPQQPSKSGFRLPPTFSPPPPTNFTLPGSILQSTHVATSTKEPAVKDAGASQQASKLKRKSHPGEELEILEAFAKRAKTSHDNNYRQGAAPPRMSVGSGSSEADAIEID